jgi:phage terminase large subunit
MEKKQNVHIADDKQKLFKLKKEVRHKEDENQKLRFTLFKYHQLMKKNNVDDTEVSPSCKVINTF